MQSLAPTQPTPWGQAAIAFTNGKTVFAPLTMPKVRLRTPRTMWIVLPANTKFH